MLRIVLGRFVRLVKKTFLLVNSSYNKGRRVPRPRIMEKPRKVIFKVDEEDYEKLKEIARRKGVYVSELLRQVVKQVIQGNIPLETEDKDEDPVVLIGISRPVTVERMLQLIDEHVNNEISRAKARVILDGIIRLKKALALQSPKARELKELKVKLRELREQYGELAREVRARSVLKPLGEELVMLSEELGVPLFELSGRKRRA